MEAIEQGLPAPPVLSEAEGPAPEPDPADEFDGCEVWEESDGTWWILFPPPAEFDGPEEGQPASRAIGAP